MEENREYLSTIEKFKLFVLGKPTRELFVAHSIIILIGSVVYFTASTPLFAVFLASSIIIELVFFHILWIYRDNQHKNNPLRYAVKAEISNIAVGLVLATVFISVNIFVSTILNFPTLLLSTIIISVLFFGYAVYKIHRARIPKNRLYE